MNITRFLRIALLSGLCLAGTSGAICAEGVLATSRIPATSGSGYPASRLNQTTPLSSITSAFSNPGPMWEFGAIAIRPHMSYDLVYGSGLLRVPGAEEKTTVQTLKPGLLLEFGSRTNADYTLSRTIYRSRGLADSTDHSFSAKTGVAHDTMKIALAGAYGTTTTILAETGGQTRDETYSTSGTFAHALGSRSEIETDLSHIVRSAAPVTDSPSWRGSDWTLWSTSTWLKYSLSKKLSTAAGFAAGYDEIKDAPDMSHVEPQVQVAWRPTNKIALTAESGLELRRSRATVSHTQKNGRYRALLSYSPIPTTTLSVGASRSIEPSYFGGETSLTSGWNASVQQRLLSKLSFSANVSQRKSTYVSSSSAISTRNDRYDSYNLALSLRVLSRGSIGLFYQRSKNHSSTAAYEFTSEQVGGNVAYNF